jgi:hypothetical protein
MKKPGISESVAEVILAERKGEYRRGRDCSHGAVMKVLPQALAVKKGKLQEIGYKIDLDN